MYAGVGQRPSGTSRKGLYCRAVFFCCIPKARIMRKKMTEKKVKRNRFTKRSPISLALIHDKLVFLVLLLSSVLCWRASEGPTLVFVLRPYA